MPEGDTLHRTARALDRRLAGEPVTRFETAYAHLARVDEDTPLSGRTVEGVSAIGKHLLVRFSGDLVLRTHLRMHGSWHLYKPGEPWRMPRSAMRVVLGTPRADAVAFNVAVAEFRTAASLARDRAITALGPDLLGETFDVAEAAARLRAEADRPVGQALLDQRVVAGIGNVYKSEVLFAARVSPSTPVAALSDEVIVRLLSTARRLMQANVSPVTGAPRLRRTTGRVNPNERLWVYRRVGQACRRCGTPVASRREGPEARSTYWCPRCQPANG